MPLRRSLAPETHTDPHTATSPDTSVETAAAPPPVARRALLVACAAVLALALWAATVNAQADSGGEAGNEPGGEAVAAQLERGAELYAWNCAVCHGATGRGYAEAKLAFPPDHRRCTRCHKPNNPARQSLDEPLDDHDMFDLGDPPPLVGEGALAAFPTALALDAYSAAAMPRYEPGRLAGDEYRAITAWLLHQNGRFAGAEPLTAENAARLGAPR